MSYRTDLARCESTGAVQTPAEEPGTEQAPRPRHARRVILIGALVLAVIGGGGLVAAGLYLRSVDSGITRFKAFDDMPEESRPGKVATDAVNLLILGSDSRNPGDTSGSRSDTIILAHLPKSRSSAQLISIPRDTWVHVPRSKDGRYGNTDAKINAAYAWGGLPLTVQTVESFTGVRIDHVVLVDFAGFKEIVDALDGVEIDVEQSFTSTHSLDPSGRRGFAKGKQLMDGAAALDYARERFAFPDGDFARIRHQQQVIKAILEKAASGGLLTNPGRLNAFLRATAGAVSVDETLDVLDTVVELRHIRSGNLTFLTSPAKGVGRAGAESIVIADPDKGRSLYEAVRLDAVGDILTAGKD